MDQLTLPDGRMLDVDAGPGEASWPVVVAHHGTPGSVVRDRHLDAAATRVGLRVVTFSRAGYGGSSRRAGRSVADVAGDVEAVLDHLGVDRAATMGASGGGPHALATAALLPRRITGVLTVAGVGPWGVDDLDFLAGMGQDNLEEFGLALDGESALRPWLEQLAPAMAQASPEQVIESIGSLLPDVDRAAMRGAGSTTFGEDLAAAMAEAVRLGVDGWLDDDLAFTTPWGFDLAEIRVPVSVWQGGADLMVPPAHGAWLADHVPGAVAHLLPDEGHLSIALGHAEQMLTELRDTLT